MSIVLPLLAAFVGASAGGAVRYLLDRQTQRDDFRAAGYVIYELLIRVQHLVLNDRDGAGRACAKSTARVFDDVDSFGASERRSIARGLLRDDVTWFELREVLTLMPEYRNALIAVETGIPVGPVTVVMPERQARADELRDEIIGPLEVVMERLGRRIYGRRLGARVRLRIYDLAPKRLKGRIIS